MIGQQICNRFTDLAVRQQTDLYRPHPQVGQHGAGLFRHQRRCHGVHPVGVTCVLYRERGQYRRRMAAQRRHRLDIGAMPAPPEGSLPAMIITTGGGVSAFMAGRVPVGGSRVGEYEKCV